MNEDRWTKIEQLVERALELPPEDRAAFIENQCGTDEALRNEFSHCWNMEKKPSPSWDILKKMWLPLLLI